MKSETPLKKHFVAVAVAVVSQLRAWRRVGAAGGAAGHVRGRRPGQRCVAGALGRGRPRRRPPAAAAAQGQSQGGQPLPPQVAAAAPVQNGPDRAAVVRRHPVLLRVDTKFTFSPVGVFSPSNVSMSALLSFQLE
jgi:hypothetical protein